MLLVGLAAVLVGMMMPYITAVWEKGNRKDAGQLLTFSIKLVSLGFTAAALGILLFSPLLFEIVLQGKYDQGLAVLPLTFVFSIWFSLFMFGQIYLWVAEKGKLVFAVTSIGLVINLLLNGLLIPSFEIWGAISATTTATLFCLVATNFAISFAGCDLDRRFWVICFLPLIVLLPLAFAFVGLAIFVAVCISTTLLFSTEEKQLIHAKVADLIGRIRNR